MGEILKLILFFISLLAAGISLTLYLPAYKVDSTETKTVVRYSVIADTLKTPLPMEAFLLAAPLASDTKFALRIGLYGQLSQAKQAAEDADTLQTYTIVKASDPNRDWYLLLSGPFASRSEAEDEQKRLQIKQISAKLVTWVEPETDS